MRRQLQSELAEIVAVTGQLVHEVERSRRVLRQEGLSHLGQDVRPHQSEQFGDRRGVQPIPKAGNRLIEKALSVAQAPGRRLGQDRDGRVLGGHPFCCDDLLQAAANLRHAQ